MNKLLDWATKYWATAGKTIPAKDGRLMIAGTHIMSPVSQETTFSAACVIDTEYNKNILCD